MRIRKTFAAAVIAALLLNLFGTGVFAADADLSANVFMTVANGELLLAQEPVEVTDYNSDGKLTLDDALYAAHEQYYEGGAAAGYGSEYGSYGLSLTKLWGVENGSGFGYYVNNASAYSLTDKVENGDYITAFVYTDTDNYSDTYCYFDKNTVSAKAGEEVTFTLSAAGYDDQWNPITVPAENAEITVNGVKTGLKTDKDGKVTLKLDTAGKLVISAVSEDTVLVPPVCRASVSAAETDSGNNNTGSGEKDDTPKSPVTGESNTVGSVAVLSAAMLAVICLAVLNLRKSYEK